MKARLMISTLLLASPFASHAGNSDYTFVEGGAIRHYPDLSIWQRPERRDGGYLAGSIALNERFYLYGDVSRTTGESSRLIADSDVYRFDHRYTLGQIGLGTRHSLSERTDALVELAYVHLNERVSTDAANWPYPHAPTRSSGSAKGAQLNVGLREVLTERIEGWMKVGYVSMRGDFMVDNGYTGEAGLQVKITPRWGVVADAQFLQAITTYRLGVRVNF